MSANLATERDLRELLREACARAGGQKAWAQEHEVSPQLVCDILQGRRDVSERIANALGFIREVRFRPFQIRRREAA